MQARDYTDTVAVSQGAVRRYCLALAIASVPASRKWNHEKRLVAERDTPRELSVDRLRLTAEQGLESAEL
jgi:hypothetical protein